MTPCDQIKARLTAYIDHEVDEAQAGEIAAHLEKCPPCAEAAHEESAIKQIVHTRARMVPAAPHLRARIRRQLASPNAASGFWEMMRQIFAYYPRPALAALGCLIISVSALTYAAARTSFSDPVTFEVNARLIGQISCADCQLMTATNTPCTHEAGVHRLVLKCSDGRLWNIVQSPPGRELLQAFGGSTQIVQTEGYLFPRLGYMQVTNFKVMQN